MSGPARVSARVSARVPVVFLLEDLDVGGTQTQTLELAARLDPARFVPTLVTLRAGSGAFAERAASRGLDWLPLTRHPGPIRFSRALPALWRYLAAEKPPLVQLLTVLPNIWGRVFGRLVGLPGIIGCCRGVSAVRGQHEGLLGGIPAAHIGNARSICDALARLPRVAAERVFFIPNGVDTDYFVPAPEETREPIVLCVARWVPVKNHRLLLEAFARVRGVMPGAKLHLVGEGECEGELRRLAASGPPESVVFLPAGTDVRPHYQGAQVFVLSSDHEGTPNAVLEAMACGLPVAATRAGGVAEAVAHGESGFLCDTGDAGALANGMLRLLTEPDTRRAFGRAGRARAEERYGMAPMVRAHEAVYDMVLARQGLLRARA